jgi:hypothetical protein
MPFTYQRVQIPSGDNGTDATVRHIVSLIQKGTVDERVRLAAVDAIAGCPWKDKLCETGAVFNWLRNNIRFVNDPWGAELLHTAESVLQNRVADCDDFVIIGGSMLRAIGVPVQIVIIAANPHNDSYSHIYLQAAVRGQGWVGFDPSVPGMPFGWEPPQFKRKKIVAIPG